MFQNVEYSRASPYNPCTEMAIRFSAEMKIESKIYNIANFHLFQNLKEKI